MNIILSYTPWFDYIFSFKLLLSVFFKISFLKYSLDNWTPPVWKKNNANIRN